LIPPRGDLCNETDGAPNDINTIAYACQWDGGTTPEVVSHILQSTLQTFRLTGKLEVAGVVVSLTEDIDLGARAA
jgi:hypothetical protein